MTLGIAQRLRDRLEADGIGVVMIRDDDVALAGDDYPELGCDGPPWRDVERRRQLGLRPESGASARGTSSRRGSTWPTSPAPMPS